ncbi:MAG: hypothetical protein EZS28_041202 [Streblomastix strix]|uniref:CBS domain-containing protein n=1 Tax=Streblomastix strix TaxID=222440 RepID=A0A5J4TZZ6_9EUKA|nr:MAG: hypothetical protein EZS28_041202 [Streblomastix strix]
MLQGIDYLLSLVEKPVLILMEEKQIVGVVNYSDVLVIVDFESQRYSMWKVYDQVMKGRCEIECYCPIVRNEKVQEPEKFGFTVQLDLSESLLLFFLKVSLITSLYMFAFLFDSLERGIVRLFANVYLD